MSSLFAGRAPHGKALLSSYLGGRRIIKTAEWDDARSVSTVLSVLEPLLGLSSTPEMVRIHRHRRGLPLYHGDYLGRMQAIDERLERLPGLCLAANYRDGISVRDRIACGRTIAERVCAAIGHHPDTRPGMKLIQVLQP
jgi:oxygen-dependent protoporphyrinogen oxidase